MAAFREGDIVKVARVDLSSHGCIGRHPEAGETGTVRTVIRGKGFITYIVERLHPDGTEDWLCDFDGEETAVCFEDGDAVVALVRDVDVAILVHRDALGIVQVLLVVAALAERAQRLCAGRSTIVTADSERWVTVWNAGSGKSLREFQAADGPNCLGRGWPAPGHREHEGYRFHLPFGATSGLSWA
jgi:hypothetical protein